MVRWLVSILLCCATLEAHAQRAFDVQTFLPPASRAMSLTIPEPELAAHGSYELGLFANYARDPLVRRVACPAGATLVDSSCLRGDRDGSTVLVSDLFQIEAAFAVPLYESLELGVVLPLGLSRVADDLAEPQRLSTAVALSDLRLSVGVPVVVGRTALRAGLLVTLPTGDEAHLVGARNWTATPSLVLRQRIGDARLGLMVGYRLRQRVIVAGLEHDDELDLAAGATIPVSRAFDLRPELRARFGIGGTTARRNENPGELDLGIGLLPWEGASLVIGGGLGIWPLRDGYGAPALRGFVGLHHSLAERSCVRRRGDTCPDPDSDGDGLSNAVDACTNDAEDHDGFADGDGCPDRDDDADGLPDAIDACPHGNEDLDGYQDGDGCPEPDNDEDTLSDAVDACAMEPEDRDGFEDADGCPEPGPQPMSISVQESRILVSERIYFDYDRDTIRAVSTPLLDELARAIRGLGKGVRVIVEGHTDDTGNRDYNIDLSHRRARAVVQHLVAQGVPVERLDYVGYGADRPLTASDSPESRELNRRVEFRLVR